MNRQSNQQSRPVVRLRPGGGGRMSSIYGNFEKPKDVKGALKRLVKYLGSNVYLMLILILVMMISTVINLLGPVIQGRAIDAIDAFEKTKLFRNILLLGIVYGIGIVVSLSSGLISAYLTQKTVRKMRKDLFGKLVHLPIRYFDNHMHGDIMSRMTNDVNEVETSVVGTLEGWIRDPLNIIITLTALLLISYQMTLLILALIPVLGLVIGRITRSLKRHSQDVASKYGETLSTLDETLGGLRVIKAFNVEKILRGKFFKSNEELLSSKNKISYRRDLASPLSEVMGVALFTAVLYFGGVMVLKNQLLQASAFLMFLGVFYNIINPAKTLSTSFSNMRKGAAAIGRIEEILNTPVTVDDNPNGKLLPAFNDKIEFRNVQFSYEDVVILDNINLTIEKGKTVALVGSSGAGKSTLADLVPRFHDVTGGEVLMSGRNL